MFSPGGHARTCRRVAAAAKRSTAGIVQLHSAYRTNLILATLGNKGNGTFVPGSLFHECGQ